MPRTVVALLGLLCLLATVPPAGAGEFPAAKLAPVDESSLNPDFKAFWTRLDEAVRSKEIAFVAAHLDPGVKVDFGPDGGLDLFNRRWGLDRDPAASDLWRVLGEIVRLGGTFDGPDRNRFTAPYVFSRFPPLFDDRFAAVTGRGIALRAAPEPTAAAVGRLDYDIVRLEPDAESPAAPADGELSFRGDSGSWVSVQTAAGLRGWVPGRYVRRAADHRLAIERRGGEWKIVLLVSGD